jgi:mRNA-degrading endonuclease RelE of RelBE toxin-antitoxin system
MSALEQTIIEKIRKLDEAQQQKILEYIQEVEEKEPFDFDAWIAKAREFRARMRANYGEGYSFGASDILNDMRE